MSTTEITNLPKIHVFSDVTPCRLVNTDVLKDRSAYNPGSSSWNFLGLFDSEDEVTKFLRHGVLYHKCRIFSSTSNLTQYMQTDDKDDNQNSCWNMARMCWEVIFNKPTLNNVFWCLTLCNPNVNTTTGNSNAAIQAGCVCDSLHLKVKRRTILETEAVVHTFSCFRIWIKATERRLHCVTRWH